MSLNVPRWLLLSTFAGALGASSAAVGKVAGESGQFLAKSCLYIIMVAVR